MIVANKLRDLPHATLMFFGLGVIWLQLFGLGAEVRSQRYLATAGTRYDFASAWLNIQAIRPLRAAIATLAPLIAISLYRGRLETTIARATADFQRHRWFWICLAAGALATAFLPLGSAGLKKGGLVVSSYSVFTYLWFVLLGVVLYPLLSPCLEPGLRAIRRRVPSVIPVLLLAAAGSGNFADFRDAVKHWTPLRDDARNSMDQVFAAQLVPHAPLRLCRPAHPYSKPSRPMTDRYLAAYFRLDNVRQRCPKHR